jgi:hypothetical protein
MSQTSSQLDSVPWPMLMLGAWVATVFIVAWLIRAIAKAAINKANAQDLAQVLAALAPMLGGLARAMVGGLARTLTVGRRLSTTLPDGQDDVDTIGSGDVEQDG